MGLIERIGRRRWRRQLRHHFAPGEDIVTFAEVMWLGGSRRGSGLMFATQFALYLPALSADVRFAYEDIEDASFESGNVGGNGILRLTISRIGVMEYACRAPEEFAPYVLTQVRSRHR